MSYLNVTCIGVGSKITYLHQCWRSEFADNGSSWTPTILTFGGFQLLDLIIMELKSHMTRYKLMPLIGWNYSIQTREQIL